MRHADDVGLGEVTAVGVHGNRPAEADVALGDERPALADAAEAVVLQLHEHHGREVVVEQRHVDVLGGDAGHLVHPLGHRAMTRRGEVLVGLLEVGEDRRPPASHSAVGRAIDVHRRLAEVLRPVRRRDDGGHRTVGLHRVVEEAERVADHAGVEVVVERQRIPEERGRACDRVVALGDATSAMCSRLVP